MTRDTKLEASLLLMRLAIAAFLLVWAVDKVIAPEHAQAVFSHFYFSELSFLDADRLQLIDLSF
jgi:hypothetical protein